MNQDQAFEEFVDRFKNRAPDPTARALWESVVGHDQTAHEFVLGGVNEYAAKNWSPSYALRKLFQAKLPAQQRAADNKSASAPQSAEPAQPTSYAEFGRLWPLWPRDPSRPAEHEDAAKMAWDQSVTRVSLDVTRDFVEFGCRYYLKLDHPPNLATYLMGRDGLGSEHDVKQTAKQYREIVAPTADVQAAFAAAFARYPTVRTAGLDEVDARAAYLAVPAEDRLRFLAAVAVYAADWESCETKSIRKWSTFCRGYWREVEGGDNFVRNALNKGLAKVVGRRPDHYEDTGDYDELCWRPDVTARIGWEEPVSDIGVAVNKAMAAARKMLDHRRQQWAAMEPVEGESYRYGYLHPVPKTREEQLSAPGSRWAFCPYCSDESCDGDRHVTDDPTPDPTKPDPYRNEAPRKFLEPGPDLPDISVEAVIAAAVETAS